MAARGFGYVAGQYEVKKISDDFVEIRWSYYPDEEDYVYVESMELPISLLEKIVRDHKKSDNK